MSSLAAQSPAEGLPPAPACKGLVLRVATPTTLLAIGGRAKDKAFAKAIETALGLTLPTPQAFSGQDPALLWQGPGRWLLQCETEGSDAAAALRKALGPEAALSDVTDGLFAIDLEGPDWRALLSQGTSLDLSAGALPPGASAVTRFADLSVTLMMRSDDRVRLLSERAGRGYLWAWLCQAAENLTQ
ncbi:MAG: hypothetical protein Kilf2KO_01410 [Rhodospirillales bacterium]